MFNLAGQIALVTGGSQGIGLATALTLARSGADVAVMSRSLGKAVGEAVRWNDLPAVVRRHHGLRDALYLRHFWSKHHMGVVAAALGWAVFGRRAPLLALAASLPYLDSRWNWRRSMFSWLLKRRAISPAKSTALLVDVASLRGALAGSSAFKAIGDAVVKGGRGRCDR